MGKTLCDGLGLLGIQQKAEDQVMNHQAKLAERRETTKRIAEGSRSAVKWRYPVFNRDDPKYHVWYRTDAGGGASTVPIVNLQRYGVKLGSLARVGGEFVFTVDTRFPCRERAMSCLTQRGEIEAFIRETLDRVRKRSLECEIQWQVAQQICERKKEEGSLLRELQAVRWHGCFHEVSTCINREGEGGKKGDIDLLVRCGRGAWGHYECFEVKGPKCTDARGALYQSLRYATAMDIEANGEAGKETEFRTNYRLAFGGHPDEKSGKRSSARRLDFGAVVVLPGEREGTPEAVRTTKKKLGALSQEVCEYLALEQQTTGGRRVKTIRALLYNLDHENRITGYEWYEWA